MTIRLKILSAVIITFTVLFVTLFLISQQVLADSFANLERQNLANNAERVRNTLLDEIGTIGSTARDWAYWNDTFVFAQGEDDGYPDDNFTYSTDVIMNLNNNFVVITDTEGDILYFQSVDFETGEETTLPPGIADYTHNIATDGSFTDVFNEVSGLYRLPDDRLVMVASRAILANSDLQGPSAGTLTFGRFVDVAKTDALSQALRLTIGIEAYTDSNLPVDFDEGTTFTTQIVNDDLIAGYIVMDDLEGAPVAIVKLEQSRDIYAQGKDTIRLLALVLMLTGVVILFATYIVVNLVVTNRITRLAKEVDLIEESGLLSRRLAVSSNDEISNLGENINNLLNRLSESHQSLNEKNQALELAYQSAQEATRLKGEFLSTMSHELRTPLNAVIGYSGIMIEGIGGELDEEALRMITNIYDSSNHLLNLVNDILDLSKIEAGRMEILEEEYDLPSLVYEIQSQMKILAEQKNLIFDVEVHEDVPEVLLGDEARIKQVIINLLSNAFKFTNKGTVGLDILKNEDMINIRVRDTGIGIPPHALNYIFEEFRQVDGTSRRAYGGTGLGLAITRKLIEAMGGEIRVTSRMGEGTVFTVSLPLNPVSMMA